MVCVSSLRLRSILNLFLLPLQIPRRTANGTPYHGRYSGGILRRKKLAIAEHPEPSSAQPALLPPPPSPAAPDVIKRRLPEDEAPRGCDVTSTGPAEVTAAEPSEEAQQSSLGLATSLARVAAKEPAGGSDKGDGIGNARMAAAAEAPASAPELEIGAATQTVVSLICNPADMNVDHFPSASELNQPYLMPSMPGIILAAEPPPIHAASQESLRSTSDAAFSPLPEAPLMASSPPIPGIAPAEETALLLGLNSGGVLHARSPLPRGGPSPERGEGPSPEQSVLRHQLQAGHPVAAARPSSLIPSAGFSRPAPPLSNNPFERRRRAAQAAASQYSLLGGPAGLGGMSRQNAYGMGGPQPHSIHAGGGVGSGGGGALQSPGGRLGWLKPHKLSPGHAGPLCSDADGPAAFGGGNSDIPTCVKELLEGLPPEVFTIQRTLAQIPLRRQHPGRRQHPATATANNRSPTYVGR